MFVSASEPRTLLDGKRAHLSAGLRREDAEALAAGTDLIVAAAPIAFSQQVLAWGDESRPCGSPPPPPTPGSSSAGSRLDATSRISTSCANAGSWCSATS